MNTDENSVDDVVLGDETDLTGEKIESKEQFLTFMMADEEYGVNILSVQEIRGWEPVTPVPNAPGYIKGVINLRGAIVPIVDLRKRFDLENVEYSPITVVIVLNVIFQDHDRVMGIVADAVSEVYDFAINDMQSSPDLSHGINENYIQGLAAVDGKMVTVLDIDTLLGADVFPVDKSLANNADHLH